MGLLRSGFGEINRKLQRLVLGRQIKVAQRAYARELRNLGRRAAEAGITDAADEALRAALADTDARERDLGAKLGTLEEEIRKLEAQRDADAARFKSLADEVIARKSPLDAELATQQKAAARNRHEGDQVKRRMAKAAPEGQPAEERQNLEALLAQLAAAAAAAEGETARLGAAIAPLQAELDRIAAQRTETAARTNGAISDLRKQANQARSESAGVSRQRDMHFEKLGAVLVAAGIASPALAAQMGAVAAAAQARDALQARHDASLAESRGMPKATMAKFAGLMLASGLALAAGGYAIKNATDTSKARSTAAPAQVTVSDCPMPSVKYKVAANPGGPYNVTRGRTVRLDGGRSTGHCLKYTWTFSAAPPDEGDGPRHTGATPDDQSVFDAVARIACPDGQGGNPGARKTGRVAETVFLCSLRVTLTVTDGESTDSKDVIVHVKPRNPEQWKTALHEAQAESYMEASKLARGQLDLGKNLCVIDASPAHALHAGSPWLDEGYEHASVNDAGGPFHGWWYVGASKLRIKRAIQINADFTPGGELDKVNATKRYRDFATLRRSVIEHERLHGTIIFERIKEFQKQGNDPARLIEPLCVPPDAKDSLDSSADMALRQIETRLYPGQQTAEYVEIHREIKARLARNRAYDAPGKILIRDGEGGFVEHDIPNIAAAGEDGGS